VVKEKNTLSITKLQANVFLSISLWRICGCGHQPTHSWYYKK